MGKIPLGTKFAMLGMSPTNKKFTVWSRSRSDPIRSERRWVNVRRAHGVRSDSKSMNKDRTWMKKKYHMFELGALRCPQSVASSDDYTSN